MAIVYELHPDDPQQRLINQAAGLLANGGILAIPTDSSYALVARLDDKNAADKLRSLRGLDDRHHLTLMCRDLSEIAKFAHVDNQQYRLLKSATPGPWTFILEATKDVPRRVHHRSRKTIGIRVPAHKVTLMLLETLGEPLLATTFIAPEENEPFTNIEDFAAEYKHELAGIIDAGPCRGVGTTVIDLTQNPAEIVRRGSGDPAAIGL
ncbi:L-threonylcarbamoyladenylate synthase [Oligella urethralis]|uniref:Translation factor Sua5 n=1 Tax=Oligella urethralis DNF00040 TaxID=1401065 RepID=A0A095Z7P2_9BURK|nr:L-threonylcarbamoyladenylate synthase [Oligella urethralis]KGF30326.1 translation factor Sua5 [Oligella urethralis DNF00040]SUA65578.1 Putative translation factor (SUA5) [Oligella urethralis]